MAPLPAGRVFNAVVASGAYVFVIGGTSDAGGATPTDTVYRYDTGTDSWSTMTAMPAALSQIDGIDIGGVIYIPGSDPDSNTYAYNVAGDSWSTIATNNGYTAGAQYQVVAIGTDLYVLGGIRGGRCDDRGVGSRHHDQHVVGRDRDAASAHVVRRSGDRWQHLRCRWRQASRPRAGGWRTRGSVARRR